MADRWEVLSNAKVIKPDRFNEVAQNNIPDIPLPINKVIQTPTKDKFSEAARQNLLKISDPWSEDYNPFEANRQAIALKKPAIDLEDIKQSIARGARQSTLGIVTGYAENPRRLSRDNQSMLGHFAEVLTEFGFDMPAIMAGGSVGGKVGAAAGGAIGSIVPGVGTAIGAGVGAALTGGATALGVLQAIKSSWQQYSDFVDQTNSKMTFREFVLRGKSLTGETAKATGEAAIMGATLGAVGKMAPYLSKIPGFKTLMNTKPGAVAVKTAADIAGLTGANVAMRGELPSSQEVLDFAAISLAHRLATGTAGKAKEFFKELSKPETTSRTSAFMKMLPEEVQQRIKKEFPKLGEETQKQRFKELLRKNVGGRNKAIYESQMEVKEAIDNAESINKKQFTAKQLEEMSYYKQKTGNPFVEGDTPKKLATRLPEAAKKLVDGPITDHFAKMAQSWNDNPFTRNIDPRDALKEVYMPGLYEYDTAAFNKAWEQVTSKFKTDVPFRKPKQFLNFLQAFQEAGLKPRFKSIIDFVNAYDNKVLRSLSNIKLLEDLAIHQQGDPNPYIVNSNTPEEYTKARRNGYIPMDDVFLRTHQIEATEGAKPVKYMYRTSNAPALVRPDFAQVFQGIFTKEAYRSPSGMQKALDYTDKLRDIIRFTRVEVSPFHYMSLGESALGGMGFKAPLEYVKSKNLIVDKAVVGDAIEHGVKLDYRAQESMRKPMGAISKTVNLLRKGAQELPENLASKSADKALGYIENGTNHLFEVFHPRMKLSAYQHYVNKIVKEAIMKGEKLTESQVTKIKHAAADVVNNQYGGQNWELMEFFNGKRNLNGLRRLIGYPDWSVSTIRQAFDATAPGTKGKLARDFWKRYGLIVGATIHGSSRFINSGIVQTDKKDKSITGLRFDINKGLQGLLSGGPSWYMFPIPDVDIKIPGTDIVFNPGRDAKGKKLVGRLSKQALEIGRYFTDPVGSYFSKANPLIQIAVDQIWGGTPKGFGDMWVAEGARNKYGQYKSWGGKEKFLEQLPYRAKHILKGLLPFSVRTMSDKGLAPYVGSLFGAFPVSQAISEYTATPYLEDAFLERDNKRSKDKLNIIHNLMREGGISEQRIKTRTSTVRNAIASEEYLEPLREAIKNKDMSEINKIRRKLRDRDVSPQKIAAMVKKAKS